MVSCFIFSKITASAVEAITKLLLFCSPIIQHNYSLSSALHFFFICTSTLALLAHSTLLFYFPFLQTIVPRNFFSFTVGRQGLINLIYFYILNSLQYYLLYNTYNVSVFVVTAESLYLLFKGGGDFCIDEKLRGGLKSTFLKINLNCKV